MIEFHIKISKGLVFSDPEIEEMLDKSNADYDLFIMKVPEDKREEVNDIIKHYINKGTK